MKAFSATVALICLAPATLNAAMPDTRYWWTKDANQNGEYNFSTTVAHEGSFIQVANEWGDVPTGTHFTGPYGDTPVPKIDLVFQHNGTGYAAANLTTSVTNNGLEPESFADRDAGKEIAREQATLYFSAPESVNGLRVKLVDQYGNSSQSVAIQDYRSSYGRYAFSYAIPTNVFASEAFNFDAVESVTFFVDSSLPAGDYHLSVLGILFQRNP